MHDELSDFSNSIPLEDQIIKLEIGMIYVYDHVVRAIEKISHVQVFYEEMLIQLIRLLC